MHYYFALILFFFSSLSFGQEMKIKKIEYSTDGYASAPDFDLVIYSDRTIIFNARKDNFKEKFKGETAPYGTDVNGVNIRDSEVKGIFKTKIDRKTFKEISNLIFSLESEDVKNVYLTEGLHSSTGSLKIIYVNGRVQSIHDYSLNGTENLLKLYSCFRELRFNLKWN